MAVDSTRFRAAMAQFATGVTVVTTRDAAGHRFGLTVNAFASVSLDPPLVLVCIDNRSDAHKGFQTSGVFGISVLAEGQEDWSRRFATPGAEKWNGCDVRDGPGGRGPRPRGPRPCRVPRRGRPPRRRPHDLRGRGGASRRRSGAAPPLPRERLRPRRRTSEGRMSSGTVPFEFPERFNMAWYFLDRNLEEGRGDKVCLYYRDEAYTYGEVQARANRFANALAQPRRAGGGPGPPRPPRPPGVRLRLVRSGEGRRRHRHGQPRAPRRGLRSTTSSTRAAASPWSTSRSSRRSIRCATRSPTCAT